MSTTRAIAWNTGVQFIGKAISTAIGIVVVGLMTRLLGQEGFGYYSTANAYFQVFAILLDLGLNVTLVQMLGERHGDTAYENRAASATFTFRLLTAIVLLTIAPFLALSLNYPTELKWAIFAIWGSFFFTVLNQIVIGIQQRHLKMHIVAISEVAGRIVLLGGVIAAWIFNWGLIPIVLIVSLGGFVNFAVNALVARRYASLTWNWDPAFWKELLHRSWPIGVSIFFNLIYYKADTLILSWARPFTEVGVYGAAYRVLDILVTLPFMYAGIVLPLLSHAWAKRDLPRFQSLLDQSYAVMAILAAPMITGAWVLGDRIMRTVAGNDFAASGGILKILMLAMGLIFVGTMASHAVVALQIQRRMLKVYVIVALVTLIGYIAFIPTYGMWAAAWLTVASEGAIAVASTVYTLVVSRVRIRFSAPLKAVVSALLMMLAILPIKDAWLPIPILAGVIVYGILIIASGAISPAVLKEILSFKRGMPTADAN